MTVGESLLVLLILVPGLVKLSMQLDSIEVKLDKIMGKPKKDETLRS